MASPSSLYTRVIPIFFPNIPIDFGITLPDASICF
jgi:hypothetical protein